MKSSQSSQWVPNPGPLRCMGARATKHAIIRLRFTFKSLFKMLFLEAAWNIYLSPKALYGWWRQGEGQGDGGGGFNIGADEVSCIQ